jgi:hypothetical protein
MALLLEADPVQRVLSHAVAIVRHAVEIAQPRLVAAATSRK